MKRRENGVNKNGINNGTNISKDNRGLTLVELLCSIAIFSCIIAAIGGLLVVTAKTYRGGTAETAIQQESQFAANFIENLIVDATQSVSYQYFDPSSGFVSVESESAAIAAGAGTDQDRKILIENTDGQNHEIVYRAASQDIVYRQITPAGMSADYTVAENVTRFGADVSSFVESHNVILEMEMEHDSKKYGMTYNITSRNGKVDTTPAAVTDWATIVTKDYLILEPRQTYTLDVDVLGTSTEFNCYLQENSSTMTTATKVGNRIEITLNKDEVGNSNGYFYLVIKTNAFRADGTTPLDIKTVLIEVRRVDSITLAMNKDDALASSFAAGTTYTARASVAGTPFLARDTALSADFDLDYKNPYYVQWTWDFTISGVSASADAYFEFVPNEDVNNPSLQVELKQNMPAGGRLEITALAKHPEGTISGTTYNKSGLKYGEVKESIILENSSPLIPVVAMPVDIKRGQDFMFSSIEAGSDTMLDDSFLINIRNKFSDAVAKYQWFIRYREANDDGTFGAWSEYHISYFLTTERGLVKKLNASETMCFLPDKAYEIEYIKVISNHDEKKIYWPYTTSLLDSGTGFESYTAGWDLAAETEILETEYRYLYYLDKVRFMFKENTEFGIAEGSLFAGTEDAPLQVNSKGGGIDMQLEIEGMGIELSHFQNKVRAVIEKWNASSGSWEETTAQGWSLDTAGMAIKVQNLQSSVQGKYRLKLWMEDYEPKTMGGSVTEPNCSNLSAQDYELWNETTGEGIVYMEFNP